jgi:preprotein translocase subunit SecD
MRSYLVVPGSRVGQSHVIDATATLESGAPRVTVSYDADGRDELAELTRERVGKQIAIVLDGVVLMAPVVTGPITGGSASIALGHDATPADAAALAVQLRAGALPRPLVLEATSVIAPAVPRRTVWLCLAAVCVLLVVLAVVALVRYRVGGLAVLPGVVLVALFAVAACALLGATLTMTLSLGVLVAVLLYVATSTALLERGRRGGPRGRAVAWIAGVHGVALVACVVADAVAHGPWRGFTVGLLCGVPASALVALLGTTVLAAHSTRPTTSTKD